jgi:hypothetical protein
MECLTRDVFCLLHAGQQYEARLNKTLLPLINRLPQLVLKSSQQFFNIRHVWCCIRDVQGSSTRRASTRRCCH